MISVDQLVVSFGGFELFKGISLLVSPRDRIGLVGKNGSGKSTLLNLLVGLEQPDSGKINVGDTIVFGYYSQQGLELKEDKRVIEVVKDFLHSLYTAPSGQNPC